MRFYYGLRIKRASDIIFRYSFKKYPSPVGIIGKRILLERKNYNK